MNMCVFFVLVGFREGVSIVAMGFDQNALFEPIYLSLSVSRQFHSDLSSPRMLGSKKDLDFIQLSYLSVLSQR